MNPFISFMASKTGRIVRILVGAILVIWGFFGIGGAGGVILGIVGLVPLLAGILDYLATRSRVLTSARARAGPSGPLHIPSDAERVPLRRSVACCYAGQLDGMCSASLSIKAIDCR
jgi:hypothetical protein